MITNDILRMKQLMGLKTTKSFVSENYKKEFKSRLIIEAITSGKDGLYKRIAKATGLSDETAGAFSKEASTFMKQSDEFAQVLSREGLDDVGKIQQKLSKTGYDVSNLDNAIKMYFKQNPDIAKQILKSIPEFTDNIIKNMSLETILSKQPDLVDVLKFVSSSEFKLETKDMVDDYQKLMTEIQKLVGASGGNQSLVKIFDLMEIKFKTTELSNSLGSSSVNKQSTPIKTNPNVTPKNDVNSSDGPQSYLNKYSQEELEEMHGFNSWKFFGKTLNMLSGWKFHVFGEDLKDAIYLESVLKPIVEKWGAEAKVGGKQQTTGIYDSMKPGGVQYGKQGATIYIPVDVINSGRQQDMLTDIQSAISGYKKGGNISGDQAITPSIHYRYEFVGPVPKDGLPRGNARAMYNTNDGGPYKPDDVEDLFTKKLGGNQGSNIVKPQNVVGTGFLGSKFGDTSRINWGSITNAENIKDYDNLIDKAIESGKFESISRGGFEEYGIPNFREYLMDIYNKGKGVTSNSQTPININRPKEGPSNWSDYQDPNRGNNPYYGSGSN